MKKILLVLSVFFLVTRFCFAYQEIISERAYNQAVYDLGEGRKGYKIHSAHIHYKDSNGRFQKINTALSFDANERRWKQSSASYHCGIPEYADDWFEFNNAYEGASHTIKARPVCGHVKGKYFKDADGSVYVLYKNAFGPDIDLKVYAYWAGLKKVICINKKPSDISKDLVFKFEMDLPDKVKDKNGTSWDKRSALDFKGKTLKIGEEGKESYFRDALIWDSAANKHIVENDELKGISQSVDIQFYTKGGKTYLQKIVPSEILQKAIYPLYTDHPTSFFASSGDGYVLATGYNWSTLVTQPNGTALGYTDSVVTCVFCTRGAMGSRTICRGFFPFDTSGLGAGANIESANFNIYVVDVYVDEPDYPYVEMVQAWQDSPTELVLSDYSHVNWSRVATGTNYNSITEGAYFVKALNADGLAFINKTGWTKIALRDQHDYYGILYSQYYPWHVNGLNTRMSEYTGTDNDPYLDIITSPAGGGEQPALINACLNEQFNKGMEE
ncbi:MAG: hypothetical protein PHO42_03560 [Candidatus Omnitrophica bacterium]|nr:hypothetical protein [Candidatus Omnitrophota bacterium]